MEPALRIRCLCDTWIRDRQNISDHITGSLEAIFCVLKYLNSDPGYTSRIRNTAKSYLYLLKCLTPGQLNRAAALPHILNYNLLTVRSLDHLQQECTSSNDALGEPCGEPFPLVARSYVPNSYCQAVRMSLFQRARLPPRRLGFDSRPGHINPETSSLVWRWPWSSLFMTGIVTFITISDLCAY